LVDDPRAGYKITLKPPIYVDASGLRCDHSAGDHPCL